MFSLSTKELESVKKCIAKVAKNRKVAAACIYGSKAAGYARADSDIDLLLVLESYPYAIKYVYLQEDGIEVSVLVISKKALEADARNAALGEFAVGRLLHIYEPIINAQLLHSIERTYKRRVILEELQNVVDSMSVLGTEIFFPIEYIAFSKIKQRISRYPGAVYSYFKTYAASTASAQNLQSALRGYRDALQEIMLDDAGLVSRDGELLQISDKAIFVEGGKAKLKVSTRIQQMGSYIVHTYAGRAVLHLTVKEAESKIRRYANQSIELPEYMSSPKRKYWRLAEGGLIIDSKDWMEELAKMRGIENFRIALKRRLGDMNSRTVLNVLRHSGGDYKIVVKELARTKSVKWAALSLWTSPVKRFKVGPLFRLGTEYKATRFIRKLGLDSPAIEAVVLDERLLITKFIEGRTIAEAIRDCVNGNGDYDLLRRAGIQIGKIHNASASLGNIKPKNVVVSGGRLFFTDLEQFLFSPSDQAWDLAQFISWDLKGTRNGEAASRITSEFLNGYAETVRDNTNIAKLAKSRRYLESFLPLLSPAIAQAIKNEVRRMAG